MPKYIIKIRDRYFEWSTVVDAPTTYGMTDEELREHVRCECGEEGMKELPARLERVAEKGTSSRGNTSLAELLQCNRAGEGEKHLTEDEIYAAYANPPNDPKLSDRGARRATCVAGGEGGGQEAGSVTRGTVRCSAWLGVSGLIGLMPLQE